MALSIGTKIPSHISESATVLTEFDLGYYGWRVVLAACLGVMAGFGSLFVYTFAVFVKPLGAEFHWNRESVSFGFGLAAISLGLVSPLLGRLIDRFGPERALAANYAVGILFIAAVALVAMPYLILIGAIFFSGMTIIGSQTGANAACGKLYPARMRTSGLGWALGIGRLGGIAAPILGGWLLARGLPPRQIFLCACFFALVAAVATALLAFRGSRAESPMLSEIAS